MALLTFLPQWGVVFLTGFLLYYDIFIAMLIQTWAFVCFNKVVTAQYILWYLTLVPIVLINNNLATNKVWLGALAVLNFGAGLHWAFWAYQFEFEGWHTFAEIQYACYIWFAINIYGLYSFIVNHRMTITKSISVEEMKGEEKDKIKYE